MRLNATQWTDMDSECRIEARRQYGGHFVYCCINKAGEVLNKSGEWESEPMPSNRDEAFLDRCRFDTFEDAHRALSRAL